MRPDRGAPGDFEGRLARARSVGAPEASEQLSLLTAVLTHQRERAATGEVRAAAARVEESALTNRLTQLFPLLDLAAAVAPIISEVEPAVAALETRVPPPLLEAGLMVSSAGDAHRRELIEAWLDDPSLLDPRLGLWIRIAAAPLLELAAARVEPPGKEEWTGRACPVCGDAPQCSVIVEESGAFLQGSPRYLVCARCASWWTFARAVCACCGEDDSRQVAPYVAEGRPWVRIDACDTCKGYIKTFDLRETGASGVVPLVDDIATLALDVWAHEHGLQRPVLSLAGV